MKECNKSAGASETKQSVQQAPLPSRKKEILVPIDFSRASIQALRRARDMALREKAELILLNVIEEPKSFHTLDVVGQHRARYEQHAGQLHELAHRELEAAIPSRIEVREGNPGEEIVRLASRFQVNLIVLGRHAHHGFWHWGHNHTASKLSKESPCPVLLLAPERLN